jgi:hypothetical protein
MSGKYRELDGETVSGAMAETGQGLLFIGGVPAIDIEGSGTSAVRGAPSGSVTRDYGFDCSAQAFARMEVVRLRARAAVKDALKRGLLVRPSACQSCGAPGKPESHHADYSKPLDVTFLCDRCHTKETKRLAALARASLPTGIHTPGFKGTPSWVTKAIREKQEQPA